MTQTRSIEITATENGTFYLIRFDCRGVSVSTTKRDGFENVPAEADVAVVSRIRETAKKLESTLAATLQSTPISVCSLTYDLNSKVVKAVRFSNFLGTSMPVDMPKTAAKIQAAMK